MPPTSPPLHEPLGVVLGTRAKVDLLRVLTAGGAPLSQRELARRAGVTLRSAQAALADIERLGGQLRAARTSIGKVIYGQQDVIDQTLVALLSGGHLLLIGVPGLAKTKLVDTLGVVLAESPSIQRLLAAVDAAHQDV